MSQHAIILFAVAVILPLLICVLAWRVTEGWLWRGAAVLTACAAWAGALAFLMLQFEGAIAYSAANTVVLIATAGFAANLALGALFVWFWLRDKVKGGEK